MTLIGVVNSLFYSSDFQNYINYKRVSGRFPPWFWQAIHHSIIVIICVVIRGYYLVQTTGPSFHSPPIPEYHQYWSQLQVWKTKKFQTLRMENFRTILKDK